MVLSHDDANSVVGGFFDGGESAREVRGTVEEEERKISFLEAVCAQKVWSVLGFCIQGASEVLTYFKHNSPGCPCAFCDIDCAAVRGVSDNGEDLGGKMDWVAVGVGRFLGFAAGFRERGAIEQELVESGDRQENGG